VIGIVLTAGILYSIVRQKIDVTPDLSPERTSTVAVRALCEFTAKEGDLDLRFTPAPSAIQGIAGHAEVTSRRGPRYEREVSLAGSHYHLSVRGRADGYDPVLNRLEEIKTHRGDVERIPHNHQQLHWAQAKVYAWLMCQTRGLDAMQVALVYFNVTSQKETVFSAQHDAASLRLFFEALCERFIDWADRETAHRTARDSALITLDFPHGKFRKGQRALSEAVYKASVGGRSLLAQAPTGIGKTMGTVFPVLKAMPGQRVDKVFFLTAKTPGRQVALNALQALNDGLTALPLRVLELVARDKSCEHPTLECHGESCPLARGFYDRLPQARQAAAERGLLNKSTLRTVALQHDVCPYYLSQEMVRWSDVVVGDYNHFFDLSAHLFTHTVNEGWRVSLLVDEAHNLIERARLMYTCEIEQAALRGLRRAAPASLKTSLTRLHHAWETLVQDQTAFYEVHDAPPEKIIQALQKMVADITELLAQQPTLVVGELQRFYFDALVFLRLAELHGTHALFDVSLPDARTPGQIDSTLCIRNVVPGAHLKQRWAAAHSATLFSATLKPQQYLVDMLGLPENSAWIDVPTAFSPHQLQVRVAHHISTRFRDRVHSLGSLVDVMARQFEQVPGNYLAFFSSFDYLQMAVDELALRYPNVPVWQQSRGMSEADRSAFLARFTEHSHGVGFAVLGGAFGEGIDLPGARLIGAFIATLGLPQINPVNEAIKARMQTCLQLDARQTNDYAYLYPGLQKVVQAAGRVIRTPQDEGVVLLMDDRFARPEVQALLPAWWAVNASPPGTRSAAAHSAA
jgi:DNA excision repair protein ERCC-2